MFENLQDHDDAQDRPSSYNKKFLLPRLPFYTSLPSNELIIDAVISLLVLVVWCRHPLLWDIEPAEVWTGWSNGCFRSQVIRFQILFLVQTLSFLSN